MKTYESMLHTDDMQALVDYLNETATAYYVFDEPIISDAQWDRLYDRLIEIEKSEGRRLSNSPTLRVGGPSLDAFPSHEHITPLWSMDKAQNFTQLQDWIGRCERFVKISPYSFGPLSFYIEYKFDGLSLNLTYDGGRLIQAATRGNGRVGEAILPQARTIKSIPLTIPYKGLMEVQGECIMRWSSFYEYNKKAPEPLKNPRNGAAGALRNLDPSVTAQRNLDAFFYQVGTISDPPFNDQKGMFKFLYENGFPVSPYLKLTHSIDEIKIILKDLIEERHELDFLIDGATIKINDLLLREQMGYTEKFPRWAIAYKFEAEENVTSLLNVSWDVGRTGKLTPVAHLEPVDFSGVTVKRATLNNWNDIKRKNLTLNAQVWVRRSNDVIPEITGRIKDVAPKEQAIIKPSNCPYCNTALVEIGAHLFCLNKISCKPQIVASLAHFASRNAMDINNLSTKTLSALYDAYKISKPYQLYDLNKDMLINMPGFKEKRAQNLLKAIDNSKRPSFSAFIFSLGIANIGSKAARDLADAFKDINSLIRAEEAELLALPDMGVVGANSIIDYFASEENLDNLQRLLAQGVDIKYSSIQEENLVLQGKNIVLTGSLPHLTRSQTEALIRKHGGNPSSSVSRNTSLVVAGEKAGSKLVRAQALDITILTEKDFLDLLGENLEELSFK